MKSLLLLLIFNAASLAEQTTDIAATAEELAEAQDELSADVMELVEEQTVPQVIELLEEVEDIMAEVIDALIEVETGGPTIAAQTEIIEKIFEAAKQRQQAGGSSEESQENMGAMLDMMERMMGREPSPSEGQQPGQEGQQPGNQGGEGMTGDSDTPNKDLAGDNNGSNQRRVIPKSAGPAGQSLPAEFRALLDAYNRNSDS
ncbi:MAG: hypothetical protein AAGC74_06530 [Verrucomicrobiota bacterium]